MEPAYAIYQKHQRGLLYSEWLNEEWKEFLEKKGITYPGEKIDKGVVLQTYAEWRRMKRSSYGDEFRQWLNDKYEKQDDGKEPVSPEV